LPARKASFGRRVIGCAKIDLSTTALLKALDQGRSKPVRVTISRPASVAGEWNADILHHGQRHDGSFDCETLASAIQQAMSTERSA
jgi:hypothetical protein